jgi:hypothetical protein
MRPLTLPFRGLLPLPFSAILHRTPPRSFPTAVCKVVQRTAGTAAGTGRELHIDRKANPDLPRSATFYDPSDLLEGLALARAWGFESPLSHHSTHVTVRLRRTVRFAHGGRDAQTPEQMTTMIRSTHLTVRLRRTVDLYRNDFSSTGSSAPHSSHLYRNVT